MNSGGPEHTAAWATVHARAKLYMGSVSSYTGIILHCHAMMLGSFAAAGRQRRLATGRSQERRNKAESKDDQQRQCKELTQWPQ